jgi:hypothetical protein
MRCPNCDKNVLSDLRWDNWIKVVNFIHCLELEQSITSATAEEMINSMMSFKTWAMEEPPEGMILNKTSQQTTNQVRRKAKS